MDTLFEDEEQDYQQYCTVPQVARDHNIPTATLYSAVNSGRIIYIRYHGRILLDTNSVKNFVTMYHKLNIK